MDAELKRLVRGRADGRCEYCRLPEGYAVQSFEIDHIIASKHGGLALADNLALACFRCNNYKGTDIAGLDPKSGKLAALFNPRKQSWSRHFAWEGAVLVGRTAVGRVTIAVLHINDDARVDLRREMIEEGDFPPP